MKYEKKPLTSLEHIVLLKKRGLDIEDETRAEKYLNSIGYYRLTGYMYHLQSNDGSHQFKEDIRFQDIILHYLFDKKLRAVFSDYLERIEVALRSKLTNNYSVLYGFYWYTQYDLYDDKKVYKAINIEINEKYQEPQELFFKVL